MNEQGQQPGVGDRVRRRARRSLGVVEAEDVHQQLDRMRARMSELEAEVAECRELNVRLAQVLDVVEQLMLPAASQDTERIAEALERYRASL